MPSSITLFLTIGGFAVGLYCGYRLAPRESNPLAALNPLGWL